MPTRRANPANIVRTAARNYRANVRSGSSFPMTRAINAALRGRSTQGRGGTGGGAGGSGG